MSKTSINITGLETKVENGKFLISKTDTKGIIKYCNKAFIDILKTTQKDLLNKPHNIIRHPDMPRSIFKLVWERISSGNEIFAFIKNLSFDGSYYWVYANIIPTFDLNGNIIGYCSVRRKANEKGILAADELYSRIRQAESSGDINAGTQCLKKELKNMSYDEFVYNLRKLG